MQYRIKFRNIGENFNRDFEENVGEIKTYPTVGGAWKGFSRALKQAGRCFDGVKKVEIISHLEGGDSIEVSVKLNSKTQQIN